jgi:hypothetical protein
VWTVDNELMAQLVELTSIVATDRQLKKPITIPRPDHIRRKGRAYQSGVKEVPENPYKQGIAVLQATSPRRRAVSR